MSRREDREYSVIIYGATGFTGRLVAEYFAKHVHDVPWAIGGRNAERLEGVRASIEREDIGIVVADSFSEEQLRAMARRAGVIITTVGPFLQYGERLVAACAEEGTDYIDSTGETPFMNQMIQKYDATARRSGAIIVPACGFDSLPSDLGTQMVVEHISKTYNAKTASVTGYVRFNGRPSGGTLRTMMLIAGDPSVRRGAGHPKFLVPAEQHDAINPVPEVRIPRWEPAGPNAEGCWTSPFVMSAVNTRVVRRSAGIWAQDDATRYSSPGRGFAYSEMQWSTSFFESVVSFATLVLLGIVLYFGVLRRLASRFVPAVGEGPSRAAMQAAWFELTLVGEPEGADGQTIPRRVRGRISGGDPGYLETAKMLAEAGLTLVHHRNEVPGARRGGGLLTPATAMGSVLRQRLDEAGIRFQILDA